MRKRGQALSRVKSINIPSLRPASPPPPLPESRDSLFSLPENRQTPGLLPAPRLQPVGSSGGKHSPTRFKEKTKFTELPAPGVTRGDSCPRPRVAGLQPRGHGGGERSVPAIPTHLAGASQLARGEVQGEGGGGSSHGRVRWRGGEGGRGEPGGRRLARRLPSPGRAPTCEAGSAWATFPGSGESPGSGRAPQAPPPRGATSPSRRRRSPRRSCSPQSGPCLPTTPAPATENRSARRAGRGKGKEGRGSGAPGAPSAGGRHPAPPRTPARARGLPAASRRPGSRKPVLPFAAASSPAHSSSGAGSRSAARVHAVMSAAARALLRGAAGPPAGPSGHRRAARAGEGPGSPEPPRTRRLPQVRAPGSPPSRSIGPEPLRG